MYIENYLYHILLNQTKQDSFNDEDIHIFLLIKKTSWYIDNVSTDEDVHLMASTSFSQHKRGQIYLNELIPEEIDSETLTKNKIREFASIFKNILINGIDEKEISKMNMGQFRIESLSDLQDTFKNVNNTERLRLKKIITDQAIEKILKGNSSIQRIEITNENRSEFIASIEEKYSSSTFFLIKNSEENTELSESIIAEKCKKSVSDDSSINYILEIHGDSTESMIIKAEQETIIKLIDDLPAYAEENTDTQITTQLTSSLARYYKRTTAIKFCDLMINFDNITVDITPILGLLTYAFAKKEDDNEQLKDYDRLNMLENWCFDCQTAHGNNASCWEGSVERASFLGYCFMEAEREATHTSSKNAINNYFKVLADAYAGNKINSIDNLPDPLLAQLTAIAILKRYQNKKDNKLKIPKWEVNSSGQLSDATCEWISTKGYDELNSLVEDYVENPSSPKLLKDRLIRFYLPIMEEILQEIGYSPYQAQITLYTATFEPFSSYEEISNKSMQHWAYILSSALNLLTKDVRFRQGNFPDSFDSFAKDIKKRWYEPIYIAFDRVLACETSDIKEYLWDENTSLMIPPLRDETQIKRCVALLENPETKFWKETMWPCIFSTDSNILAQLLPFLSSETLESQDSIGNTIAHYGLTFASTDLFVKILDKMSIDSLQIQNENGDNVLLYLIDQGLESSDSEFEHSEITIQMIDILCKKMPYAYLIHRNYERENILDMCYNQNLNMANTIEASENDNPEKVQLTTINKVFFHLIKILPVDIFFDGNEHCLAKKLFTGPQYKWLQPHRIHILERLEQKHLDFKFSNDSSFLQTTLQKSNHECAKTLIGKMSREQLLYKDAHKQTASDIIQGIISWCPSVDIEKFEQSAKYIAERIAYFDEITKKEIASNNKKNPLQPISTHPKGGALASVSLMKKNTSTEKATQDDDESDSDSDSDKRGLFRITNGNKKI